MNLIEKLGLEKCQAIVDGGALINKGNKFNKGDYVVLVGKDPFNWLYKVLYECTEDRFMLHRHDMWPKDTAFQAWPKRHQIRYATPDEIKAGHRLIDITDHCTDIRNHISPLTGVIER